MASCPPNPLLESGKAFQEVDALALALIQTQLLYQIAGSSMTVAQLLASGMTNFGAISTDPGAIALVQTQLLCEILNGGGGSSGFSNQVKVYTSDPNLEGVVPDDQTKVGFAYSSNGMGAIYTWDTVAKTWH